MSYPITEVRALFPSLSQAAKGGQLPIFLDNPAGTQVPRSVMEAVTAYYMTMNANSGGHFTTSRRNDAMAARVRESMADFLNAASPSEIVIGANMTTLNFALSRSLARRLQPGDEIVLTRMDHDANLSPWTLIARDHELRIKWVEMNRADCTLDMGSLEAALSERTRIVATAHASNAVGTVNPVGQIAGMAHAVGALHVVDAVQSAPHLPLDVQAIGCDFLLCSSYKFYGPHLGIMWGRQDLLNSLPVYKVRPAKDKAPHRWENGTPSYETWHGLLACLEHWRAFGERHGQAELPGYQGPRLQMKRAIRLAQDYESQLVSQLIAGLRAIPGVEIAGIVDSDRLDWRVPTVSMVKAGIAPDEMAAALAAREVYVWSGDYYAPEIMRRLERPEGMVRIGIAKYNTSAEIDTLLNLIDAL